VFNVLDVPTMRAMLTLPLFFFVVLGHEVGFHLLNPFFISLVLDSSTAVVVVRDGLRIFLFLVKPIEETLVTKVVLLTKND
jgi:hypothetical protein